MSGDSLLKRLLNGDPEPARSLRPGHPPLAPVPPGAGTTGAGEVSFSDLDSLSEAAQTAEDVSSSVRENLSKPIRTADTTSGALREFLSGPALEKMAGEWNGSLKALSDSVEVLSPKFTRTVRAYRKSESDSITVINAIWKVGG